MADTKLADLTAETTPTSDDLIYLVGDPAGTPVDRKTTVGDLATTIAGTSAMTSVFAALATAKGFVAHGATASTARPSGYASVEWFGTVEPTNWIDGDTWIDPS